MTFSNQEIYTLGQHSWNILATFRSKQTYKQEIMLKRHEVFLKNDNFSTLGKASRGFEFEVSSVLINFSPGTVYPITN